MPKYELHMSIEADVVDDRLRQHVDAAQKELQEQASAYVDVVIRNQLTEKLTKAFGRFSPSAQLAQIAVNVLVEELKHITLQLGTPRAELMEEKDATPLPVYRIEAEDTDQNGRYSGEEG